MTFKQTITKKYTAVKKRTDAFLSRRSHRSFRRTKRRDYVRALALPGYWSFTFKVNAMLKKYKWLFLLLAMTYGIFSVLFVGMASQDTYVQMQESIGAASDSVLGGNLAQLGEAGALFFGGIGGAFSQTPTDTQRIFAAFLSLFAWLAVVWALRSILSGTVPKVRDAIYNSGAPIAPFMIIVGIIILQLLPFAVAILGLTAATTTGFLTNGVEAMLFWVVFALLSVLSVYWLSASFIASVIVTLPGMYPLRALKIASDLVVGRRFRILLRIAWALLLLILTWLIVMIPLILLDMFIKDLWPVITWLPIVPIAFTALTSLTVVWLSSYVYLLYREIVDADAATN